MHHDRHSRKESDDAGPPTVKDDNRFPKPAGRRLMPQLWRTDSQFAACVTFIAAAALGQALMTVASAGRKMAPAMRNLMKESLQKVRNTSVVQRI
jgi:hypothetical protein